VASIISACEHEVVEPLPEDLLRELERRACGETLGERLHPILEEATLLPGTECRRRGFRLDTDHSHGRIDRLGDDAGAGGAAATADGDDDHGGLRLLLEDFERLRCDAGDQQRLIAGVDVAVAVLVGELLAMLARIVVVAAVKDELGAEAAHRGHLHRVRVLGYADRRLHAEETGGEGERLAVVSGRGGDDAAPALIRGELRDQVDAAPHLEGADRLVVLVLDEHLRVEQFAQGGVAVKRRGPQVRRDSTPCLQHIGERRHLPFHRALDRSER
jgi:hypothetical protein